MDLTLLLGLACLCSPMTALVLDFNTIRSSAEAGSSKKSGHCLADKDCPAGKFCHKPWEEIPFCAVCRGLRRRCHHSAMCCPGTLCVNDVCSVIDKVTPAEEMKSEKQIGATFKDVLPHPIPAEQALKQGNTQVESDRAEEGESCLRTSDCAAGLCCARHFWTKICKPVLTEGQVCSRRGQKDGTQGPEIFQRCDCGPGLSCELSPRGTSQRARLRVCRKN